MDGPLVSMRLSVPWPAGPGNGFPPPVSTTFVGSQADRARPAVTARRAGRSSALGYVSYVAVSYMRSGTGTPSRPRPVDSTLSVSAHSASRAARSDSGSAFSTGHSS